MLEKLREFNDALGEAFALIPRTIESAIDFVRAWLPLIGLLTLCMIVIEMILMVMGVK